MNFTPIRYKTLGNSTLKISNICLGTMTFGQQNTQEEANEQLDYARAQGINFLDTAELYPIPPKPETRGRTEVMIGNWMKARALNKGSARENIIIATKIVGRFDGAKWFRPEGAPPRPTPQQIDFAVHRSLEALQTEYIDLYQVHWPDRLIPAFGFHAYRDYDPDDMIAIEDILTALQSHVQAGRIRYIGISNETPWGVFQYLKAASKNGWPPIVSIQNAYSLISRHFDYGLAEVCLRENIGLLAYSPLAQGYLTGKYQKGALPEGSRKALFGRLDRYETKNAQAAINAYVNLAKEFSISPLALAHKFVDTRPFVDANIIGATSVAQLKASIDAHATPWTAEMEKETFKLQSEYRSPAP